MLNERQRELYERAYYQKYGRLPYAGRTAPVQQNAPRTERRAAFLEEERLRKIREAEEARRAEAERLRKQAEAARLVAMREEKRRRDLEAELEKRRRERENLRRYEAERRKLEQEKIRAAEERHLAAKRRLEKLKRHRHRVRVFKFHLIVFLAALAGALGIMAFAGYKYFYSDGSDPSRKVAYYYDGVKEFTSPADVAYCDGNICFNFTDAAKHFDFYTAGDSTSLKYIMPAGEGSSFDDTIEFIIGSNTALVNGTPISLSAPSRYIASSLWVSCDVGDLFESGISISPDGTGKVELSRVKVLDEDGKPTRDDEGNYIYENISLHYKPMTELARVDLVELYGDAAKGLGKGSDVVFATDLSAYEQYMNPQDSNEFLTVVNKDNALDVTYIPEDLTGVIDTRADGRGILRMRMAAEMSLEAMFRELRAAGFDDVSATGAFVSYYEQAGLFAEYVNNEMASRGIGEDEAKTFVRAYCDEAGTSDFQTGLSVVMHNLDAASEEFAAEPAYKWLEENCWKFGFIVRYPQGKTDITGHAFDPCHFRFVGRYAAEIIRKNGSTLEEYMLGR